MGLVLTCEGCRESLVARPVHRGREVPCPECGAVVAVPDGVEFRELTDAAARDRRGARWMLVLAWLGAITWLVPIPAFMWWYAHGRIRRARRQGRETLPALAAARVIALVATVAHLVSYAEIVVFVL